MHSSANPAAIWIVEDDQVLAESLVLLLTLSGFQNCRHFESAEGCIQAIQRSKNWSLSPICMLLDIRLGSMSGTQLFEQLQANNWPWPVLFMSGHGDLPMAVDLLKRGAYDYLPKPCEPLRLIEKVTEALQASEEILIEQQEQQQHLERLQTLTGHEQLVFQGVLSNKTTRMIADDMSNSTRTIETHRANILKKMKVGSALELAQVHERFLMRGGKLPFSVDLSAQTPSTAVPSPIAPD